MLDPGGIRGRPGRRGTGAGGGAGDELGASSAIAEPFYRRVRRHSRPRPLAQPAPDFPSFPTTTRLTERI